MTDKKYFAWQQMITIFLLLILMVLSGCSTSRRDGPPSFYVDVSKIPNAVPKVEPLSKYGNKPFYQVFGKRYRVMTSSKNFEEEGIASWYGTQFHSRFTSSGERYNMLAMTAAHKFLPLPTYLQVTNLRNRKQVIVKVTDRGPFSGDRIIDLSYVAAKKLDMIGHGTARVHIKAIDPREFLRPRRHLLVKNNIKHHVKNKVMSTSKPRAIRHATYRLHQLS